MTAKEYRALPQRGPHRAILTPLDGEAVKFGALSLSIVPPSLNNMFVNGKKGRFKSPEYRAWQVKACNQLRRQDGWHVPGAIRVRLVFAKQQTKADLDNLIKGALDTLMAAGRIADDSNVVELRASFEKGSVGTRIEIWSALLPVSPLLSPGSADREAIHSPSLMGLGEEMARKRAADPFLGIAHQKQQEG